MSSGEPEQGLTQREAALRLNVSVGTINRRVRDGDLRLLQSGRIDPASLTPSLLAPPPATVTPARGARGRTASEARATRDELSAELLALDLAERTGQVTSIAAVEAAQFETARRLRDALLALPAQLAPSLINQPDPRQIEAHLRRAFTDFLTGQATALHDEPSPD